MHVEVLVMTSFDEGTANVLNSFLLVTFSWVRGEVLQQAGEL